MTNKMGKVAKLPGENVISTGLAFCGISAVIYLITAFNGVGNGLILFGGGVLGLLIIAVGYLKRISAALVSADLGNRSADTMGR